MRTLPDDSEDTNANLTATHPHGDFAGIAADENHRSVNLSFFTHRGGHGLATIAIPLTSANRTEEAVFGEYPHGAVLTEDYFVDL